MRTEIIEGGWYGDLDLQGNYVCLIGDQHVLYNRTTIVPLPESPIVGKKNNTLYIKTSGDGYLACKGHQDGALWIWSGKWTKLGQLHGDHSPVLFDPITDVLYAVRSGEQYDIIDYKTLKTLGSKIIPIGTQGLRYSLNNHVYTGDETNSDGFVTEYTDIGGIHIGSSYRGGMVARIVSSGVRKIIETGNTTFIRAYRLGNDIACCTCKPDKAVFKWFDILDLMGMPDEPIVTNEPPIVIPPIPNEEDVPNHLDIVQAAFNRTLAHKDPPRTTFQALDFIQQTLEMLPENEKWGYVLSDVGKENTEPVPEIGEYVRISRISLPNGQLIKILSNAPDGFAQWVEEGIEPELYHPFTPVDPDDNSEPPPNPNSDEDIEVLKQKVDQLEEEVNELKRIAIKYGDHIALQVYNKQFMCVEEGGAPEAKVASSVRLPGNVNATRNSVGPWETLKVVKP